MGKPGAPDQPGKINPDAGEPEKGAPDVGETGPAPAADPHDGDEPFPQSGGSAFSTHWTMAADGIAPEVRATSRPLSTSTSVGMPRMA
jgi:hypothetical protein